MAATVCVDGIIAKDWLNRSSAIVRNALTIAVQLGPHRKNIALPVFSCRPTWASLTSQNWNHQTGCKSTPEHMRWSQRLYVVNYSSILFSWLFSSQQSFFSLKEKFFQSCLFPSEHYPVLFWFYCHFHHLHYTNECCRRGAVILYDFLKWVFILKS